MSLSQSEAVALVTIKAATAAYPTLTEQQVIDCLNRTLRYTVRANSTAYAVGQHIALATSNGRRYECVVAGTSAASAPSYPVLGNQRMGQRIVDGTATFQDCGPIHPEKYDVNAATREAWLLKAAKVSADVDFSDQDASTKMSQLVTECNRQANRYGGRFAL